MVSAKALKIQWRGLMYTAIIDKERQEQMFRKSEERKMWTLSLLTLRITEGEGGGGGGEASLNRTKHAHVQACMDSRVAVRCCSCRLSIPFGPQRRLLQPSVTASKCGMQSKHSTHNSTRIVEQSQAGRSGGKETGEGSAEKFARVQSFHFEEVNWPIGNAYSWQRFRAGHGWQIWGSWTKRREKENENTRETIQRDSGNFKRNNEEENDVKK